MTRHIHYSPARRRLLQCWITALMLGMGCHAAMSASERMVGMGEGKDSVTFSRITRFGLKVFDIELVDNTWPTCDYVEAPTGCWGESITNATKVPGRLRVYEGAEVVYDSGDYLEDVSGITLKIRGNTTAWHNKKPYKIKLQKKADLLMRDSIDGRDKNWVLIRDENLKAMMGFEVNRQLGMMWTPGYQFVNVIINGQYEGLYMLLESVKRNTDCRLNVSKQGYIFEHDPYFWNEPLFLPSIWQEMKYTFKYPEPEDFTANDSTYMTALLRNMEASYRRNDYPDIIDVQSFAAWTLAHDILGTWDFAGTNKFYLKYDQSDTSRVVMPLLWDFDSTEADSTSWSRTHIGIMSRLFANPNRTFVDAYVKLWQQVSPTLYEHLNNLFINVRKSKQGTGIASSLQLDNTRWNTQNPIYSCFVFRTQWIQHRMPCLGRLINTLNPPGDLNIDGAVDIDDVNLIINMVLGSAPVNMRVADLNKDDTLDVADVDAEIRLFLVSKGPHTGEPIAEDNTP